MNRTTLALLAALDALITVAIGIGISLVPLTVLWAVETGFTADWLVFWRGAVDIWLLGNGVDVTVELPIALVAGLGLPAAADPFAVTIAPLTIAAYTALMGMRAGGRAATTRHWQGAVLAGTATVAILSGLAAASAIDDALKPSLWQALLLPALVYALGLATGVLRSRHRVPAGSGGRIGRMAGDVQDRLDERFDRFDRAVLAAALRGGFAAVTGIVGVSAALLALLILGNFGLVTSLYQGAQLGVAGGAVLTVAQLAFLPNLVIWTASWLVGPGFALGAGSSISPVNTTVGPIPGLPILGAVPSGDFAFGFLGLLVPVLIGFFAASLVRPRLVPALAGRNLLARLLITAAGIGVVAGILLGMLAWFSAGAIGPGRLVEAGPNPWLVAVFTAVEVAVAAAIGMASGRMPTDAGSPGASLRAADRIR